MLLYIELDDDVSFDKIPAAYREFPLYVIDKDVHLPVSNTILR